MRAITYHKRAATLLTSIMKIKAKQDFLKLKDLSNFENSRFLFAQRYGQERSSTVDECIL